MNAGVSTSEMAVRVNGEGITLWPACEADNRPTNSNTATHSVAYVSRSGGMSNELNNIISRSTNGVYEGVAIGGDR